MVEMMFGYGGHWPFWEAGLMWAGMIVFWGLLIWGVYALIRSANRRPPSSASGGEARHILDERLARGEIDPGEYDRLRDLISSGSSPRDQASSGQPS
jgi:putative membrane protein